MQKDRVKHVSLFVSFVTYCTVLFTLGPINTYAKVIQAASGSTSDLQSAINSSSIGDSVKIPAGTFLFSGSVTLNAGITLMGAGDSLTILAKTGISTEAMLVVDGSNGQPVTISGITLCGIDNQTTSIMDKGIRLKNNCKDFRIHHCTLKRFGEAGIYIYPNTGGANTRGVIDHCNFLYIYRPTIANYGYGVAVYGDADASWSRPLELGTENAIYVEDCYFIGYRHAIASNNGSHYVFRYNKLVNDMLNSQSIDAHGLGYGSSRGSRSYEIYCNTVDITVPSWCAIAIRGGDGVIFGNTMIKGATSAILLYNDAGAGSYPMPDQIRSLYVWNNTYAGNPVCATVRDGCANIIQKDRDYFCFQKPGYVPYAYPHPLTTGTSTGVAHALCAGEQPLSVFPNPFNPLMSITFSLSEAAQVKSSVFNLNGGCVRNLVNEKLNSGMYTTTWDAKASNGQTVSSGVYVVHMETGKTVRSKSQIL